MRYGRTFRGVVLFTTFLIALIFLFCDDALTNRCLISTREKRARRALPRRSKDKSKNNVVLLATINVIPSWTEAAKIPWVMKTHIYE